MGTLSGEPSAPTLFSVSPFPQCLPVAHLTGGSISPEAPRLDSLPAAQLRARQLGAAVSGPPRGGAVPGWPEPPSWGWGPAAAPSRERNGRLRFDPVCGGEVGVTACVPVMCSCSLSSQALSYPALRTSGHRAVSSRNNRDGWSWEGGGRQVHVGADMGKPMTDSCWSSVETSGFCQFCIAIVFQLKINKFKHTHMLVHTVVHIQFYSVLQNILL